MKELLKHFIGVPIIIAGILSIAVFMQEHKDLPVTIFSAFAAYFTYLAYRFSLERFRYDLFERRWEIYSETLKFLSSNLQVGLRAMPGDEQKRALVMDGIKAAHNSFRSLGWHKSCALFGEDIFDLFDKLNSSFSWLSSHDSDSTNSDIWLEHVTFLNQTLNDLPRIFAPYIYFGNYKSNRQLIKKI